MKPELLSELDRFLHQMENELDICNKNELSKRHITTRIIKLVMILMLCVGSANTWYLYVLSEGLSDTLQEVDLMADGFTEITGTLVHITDSMQTMDSQLTAMESIETDMTGMTMNVADMTDTFTGITGIVNDMDGQIKGFETSIGQMDGQMGYLTGNVRNIGNSMHTMSRPMSFISSMMPW